MSSSPLIDDALFREEVRRARSASPEDRFRGGPELFEMACGWSESGLRSRHPDANDGEIPTMMEHRLQTMRRNEAAR